MPEFKINIVTNKSQPTYTQNLATTTYLRWAYKRRHKVNFVLPVLGPTPTTTYVQHVWVQHSWPVTSAHIISPCSKIKGCDIKCCKTNRFHRQLGFWLLHPHAGSLCLTHWCCMAVGTGGCTTGFAFLTLLVSMGEGNHGLKTLSVDHFWWGSRLTHSTLADV